MNKICKVCNKAFVKTTNAQKYCSNDCYKEANKEGSKKYGQEHKEERKEYNKDYNQENTERIKIRAKKYNQEHREEYNEWQKERRKDPIIKLNCNISNAIRNSLKFKGISKAGRHWEDLVGYTVQELKGHIEKLFLPGMTWDNHSMFGWHIDHIKQKCRFNIVEVGDSEFLECWSLKNLRPLWAKDNLSRPKFIS